MADADIDTFKFDWAAALERARAFDECRERDAVMANLEAYAYKRLADIETDMTRLAQLAKSRADHAAHAASHDDGKDIETES